MRHIGWNTWPVLVSLFHKTTKKVRLIAYSHNGTVDWDTALLDFLLEDDANVRFTSTNGGDLFEVETFAWVDPYPEPTAEIQADTEQYGRFLLIDVSERMPYIDLVGKRVNAIYPLINQFDLLAGVRLRIGSVWLNIVGSGDETHILWGKEGSELMRQGFRILEE